MPQPVKPPMTLKEAKRAHKKDGTGFRYTASQMARADRQDAQEEKRRKALEKERTKRENKRKREEKAERDRAVKQKMLDEGRIAIEDTWGKVAASQPRLNKFFAQPRTNPAPPPRLAYKTTSNSGERRQDDPSAGLRLEIEDTVGGRKVDETTTKINVQPDLGAPDALPASEAPAKTGQGTKPLDTRTFSSSPKPRGRQSSPLQERHLSKINARAGHNPHNSSFSKIDSKIQQSQNNLTTINESTKLQNPPRSSLSSTGPIKLTNSAPTERSDKTKHRPAAEGHLPIPAANKSRKELKSASCKSTIPEQNQEFEEDFTDGIDDNEFLRLCAAQTATSSKKCSSISPLEDPSSEILPTLISNDHTTSTIELPHLSLPIKDKPKTTPPLGEDSITEPLPPVLNESFSAVFNEIDDSELIAFAEQVEAGLMASGQSCSTTKNQAPKPQLVVSKNPQFQKDASKVPSAFRNETKNSHGPSKDAQVTPMKRPLPQNGQKPPSQARVATRSTNNQPTTHVEAAKPTFPVASKLHSPNPSQVKPKRRRAMPWDDIDGPGPSTQAVILELLEEAEAKMKR